MICSSFFVTFSHSLCHLMSPWWWLLRDYRAHILQLLKLLGNSFGWFGLLMVSSVFYWIAYSPVWNYVPHPTVILYAHVGGWESITMHTSEQKRVKKLWIQLATGQVINTADKYAFYNKFGVLLLSISLECRNNCEHRSSHKHKEGSPQEDWSFAHFKLDHFCFLLR